LKSKYEKSAGISSFGMVGKGVVMKVVLLILQDYYNIYFQIEIEIGCFLFYGFPSR
jgi:hypothetical protein